jgi:hypothetical protein
MSVGTTFSAAIQWFSLTGVAADGEVMERAQAFACAHVQRAVLYESPQLNAIR